MKFKPPELIKTGFSADGNTAYCEVSIDADVPVTEDSFASVSVKLNLPVQATETLAQVRERAIEVAIGIVREALTAAPAP